jgi:uncharacterized membrane protein
MLFPIVKWLHILAAIVAVGANITYGIWLARASRQPEVLPFTLRTIKLIDDRMANPAYGFLLLTGLIMVFTVPIPLSRTPWLQLALVFYILLVLLGLLGYTPTLRRQIQLLGSEGAASPAYQAMARRGRSIGILLAVVVLIITYLMVVKPSLWA